MSNEEIMVRQAQLKDRMNEWLLEQEVGNSDKWLDTHELLSKFLDDTVNYGRVARALNLSDNAFYIMKPFSYGQFMVAHFTHPQSNPMVRITIVLEEEEYAFDEGATVIQLPQLAGRLDIEHPLRGRKAREDYDYLGDVPMDLTEFV